MIEFKSFHELPGLETPESSTVPNADSAQEKPERKSKHELMLDAMGVNPEDNPKLDKEDFFDLAMARCGYMGKRHEFTHSSRKVILASTFQKAFIAYYELKGPQKNIKYTEWFDQAYRDKKIDFIPHSQGTDIFLCLPKSTE